MTPPSPYLVALRTSLVVIVVLAVQLGIAPGLSLFGVQADLPLLVAIGAGIATGPDRGAAIGFGTGLAYDLLLQTPFALSALTYALVAYVVGGMQDSVLRAAWWIPVTTAAIASMVGVILYGVFGTVLGEDLIDLDLLRVAGIVGLLNAIAAPLVLPAVRWAAGGRGRSMPVRAVYR
jgi:rod shape-determining protein MreD